jgi:hypothetical protein
MTSLSKPTNVSVPLDGSWVQVGEGPLRLTLVSPNNSILVAAHATAPDNTFAGDVFVAQPGHNPIDFDTDVVIWAKAKGTPDQSKPIIVLLQPLVDAPLVISAENRQPGAVVPATAKSYTAGQAIGGAFPIPGALGNGGGLLRSILIKSVTEFSGELDLHLFSYNPVASAFADGSTAGPLEPADVPYYLGVFKLPTADTSLGISVWQLNDINQMLVAAAGVVYGVLVPKGAVALNASTDISVTLGIQQGGSAAM